MLNQYSLLTDKTFSFKTYDFLENLILNDIALKKAVDYEIVKKENGEEENVKKENDILPVMSSTN